MHDEQDSLVFPNFWIGIHNPLMPSAAVKVGMMCACGQRLLMMDADGATQVSDLELLEAKLFEISGVLLQCSCKGLLFTLTLFSWAL
jgi:hypothetical protein